jgi:hypothetical protein
MENELDSIMRLHHEALDRLARRLRAMDLISYDVTAIKIQFRTEKDGTILAQGKITTTITA